MRKIIICFLMILISLPLFSLKKEYIIGDWFIKESLNKNSIDGITLSLMDNGEYELSESALYISELSGKWKYNSSKKQIIIGKSSFAIELKIYSYFNDSSTKYKTDMLVLDDTIGLIHVNEQNTIKEHLQLYKKWMANEVLVNEQNKKMDRIEDIQKMLDDKVISNYFKKNYPKYHRHLDKDVYLSDGTNVGKFYEIFRMPLLNKNPYTGEKINFRLSDSATKDNAIELSFGKLLDNSTFIFKINSNKLGVIGMRQGFISNPDNWLASFLLFKSTLSEYPRKDYYDTKLINSYQSSIPAFIVLWDDTLVDGKIIHIDDEITIKSTIGTKKHLLSQILMIFSTEDEYEAVMKKYNEKLSTSDESIIALEGMIYNNDNDKEKTTIQLSSKTKKYLGLSVTGITIGTLLIGAGIGLSVPFSFYPYSVYNQQKILLAQYLQAVPLLIVGMAILGVLGIGGIALMVVGVISTINFNSTRKKRVHLFIDGIPNDWNLMRIGITVKL